MFQVFCLLYCELCSLQGKDLYMDLDSDSLRLVDTQDFTTLNSQPIQSIRVWGVGRDNGRSVSAM